MEAMKKLGISRTQFCYPHMGVYQIGSQMNATNGVVIE